MLDWALGLVGFLTALYWYLTWHYGYWRAQGVYTLPGVLPGIGHMWDVITFKTSAHWMYCDLYHQTKGKPAVGLYNFRQPSLLVRDLTLVQAILVSDFSSFHDNPTLVDESIDPYAAKNPFLLKGQKWKTIRQKLAPALSVSRVKNMFSVMEKVCQEFNAYIGKHLNEEINVKQVTGLFTSEVVAKCAFGVEGNAFTNPNAEFYQQGRKLWDGTISSPFLMLIFFYFPSLNSILRQSFFPKDVVEFFKSLIRQTAEYSNKNPENTSEDYLQYLFGLSKKDPEFTLDDIVAQSLTFFTDGFETTSVVASFMLYELTVNPDIQDQLRRDLQAMETFSYENISTLPLLDRAFNETMRKYSVISMMKDCTQDTELRADGFSYQITKGTKAIVPVYAIHHDPDIYPNPSKFDPDRFLPENIKKRHPVAFLGISAGPRMCIGYRLATAQVKVLIANILVHFRLLKCNKTVEKVNLDKMILFPVSDKELWIKLEKL